MNTNTEREELAEVLANARYSNLVPAWPLRADRSPVKFFSRKEADAILAAGYRKPRTINDRHEDNGSDELAPLSVVLSGGKPAIMQHDGTFMDYDGGSWDTWEMNYPLTVIWEPETEPTK